jgi:hypothetical protein
MAQGHLVRSPKCSAPTLSKWRSAASSEVPVGDNPAIGGDDKIRLGTLRVLHNDGAPLTGRTTGAEMGSVWVANAAKLPGFGVTRRTTRPRKPLFDGV